VIVGCGMIARFHARALSEVPGARLVGLVSRSLASARKMQEELNRDVPLDTELSTALARPEVGAVIVTTPSGAHAEPAIAAARAGKHAVVEKPLEITTARCDEIISAGSSNPAAISHLGHARQLVDGREGRKAVAIIQEIYAAAGGKTIAL
jgi:predicted dehydrogenase